MGWKYLIFAIVITVVTLVIMAALIFRPTPIKYLINRLHTSVSYDPAKTAKITSKYTLYTRPTSKHDKLIVVFIGGCGLFSQLNSIYGITNWLDNRLGNEHEYDVVTFNYPTRFQHTVLDSMLSINKSLLDFVHYPNVHVIGVSFGALLAGAFYHKESSLEISKNMRVPQIGLKFKSFTALSGLFEVNFNAKFLTTLVDYYIMKNVPSKENYTCYNMKLPKFAVSAVSDFLVAQTVKFCSTEREHTQCKVYDSTSLPHAFPQFLNLTESMETLEMVAVFILKIDSDSRYDVTSREGMDIEPASIQQITVR